MKFISFKTKPFINNGNISHGCAIILYCLRIQRIEGNLAKIKMHYLVCGLIKSYNLYGLDVGMGQTTVVLLV